MEETEDHFQLQPQNLAKKIHLRHISHAVSLNQIPCFHSFVDGSTGETLAIVAENDRGHPRGMS